MCDLVHDVEDIFNLRLLQIASENKPFSEICVMPGKLQFAVSRALFIFKEKDFQMLLAANIGHVFSSHRALGHIIMLTCPCSLEPLRHHLYLVKVEFTEVYIILLNLLLNNDWGYSLEQHQRGGPNVHVRSPKICFEQK